MAKQSTSIMGQKFGKWTVRSEAPKDKNGKRVFCDCECGTKNVSINVQDLKQGKSKSCGCIRKAGKLALIGQKIGMLTVLSDAPPENGASVLRCRCDCGQIVLVVGRDLREKRVQSCGCMKMAKREELIGQIFGRLTVKMTGLVVDEKATVICDCECGTTGYSTRIDALKSGNTQSCGCIYQERKIILEVGQKFNRLTIVENLPVKDGKNMVRCTCDCGKEGVIVISSDLISGKNQSCGCLASEIRLVNIKAAIEHNTIYSPMIASARGVWRGKYHDGGLSFEDFHKLSQLPCFYCALEPYVSYNRFRLYPRQNMSQAEIDSGVFVYNGLDRITSTKFHDRDNVLPSCYDCNTAKSNYTFEELKEHVQRLINHVRISQEEHRRLSGEIAMDGMFKAPDSLLIRPLIKRVYKWNYTDGHMSIEQFYQLSQMKCFYCGIGPSNNLQGFIYNGADRVDNDKLHDFDNCVTCCAKCNWAKNKHTLAEFDRWIGRLGKHFNAWKDMSEQNVIEWVLAQLKD